MRLCTSSATWIGSHSKDSKELNEAKPWFNTELSQVKPLTKLYQNTPDQTSSPSHGVFHRESPAKEKHGFLELRFSGWSDAFVGATSALSSKSRHGSRVTARAAPLKRVNTTNGRAAWVVSDGTSGEFMRHRTCPCSGACAQSTFERPVAALSR